MNVGAFYCLVLSCCVAVVACKPTIPAQIADILVTEQITQRFLVERPEAEQADIYHSLIGPDASKLLATIDPSAAKAAQDGQLAAQGNLILMTRLNPYDTTRYLVEGHGQLEVYNQDELLISVDMSIGNSDMHAISDLEKKSVVLPVHHSARLNPALLLALAKPKAEDCVLALKFPRGGEVACMARGVGSPFSADYFVKIHLSEISRGKVYTVDRAREHEVFRQNGSQIEVFGCVAFSPNPGASKLLDLRGKEFVTELAAPATVSPSAPYDNLSVPDTCGMAPVGVGASPAKER